MTILDRIPPHSLEIEACVLGCLLLNNDLLERTRHKLNGHSAELFYSLKNQRVFSAMIELTDKGLPLDMVGIRHCLKASGNLDAVDTEYLAGLEDAVPHSLSFDYYFGELLRLYNTRQKMELASRLVQAAGTAQDTSGIESELAGLLCRETADGAEGIIRPADLESEVQAIYQGGGLKRGADIGCVPLDEYYTVAPGQLSIVTGIPSHGKSSWLTWAMVCLAMRHDWRFCVYSPENHPLGKYLLRIISLYVGVNHSRLTLGHTTAGLEWVNERFIFLQPSRPTIDNLINLTRRCHEDRPLNGFIIDPWNEADASRPDGMTETEYISDSLSKLKRLAQSLNLHAWVVAHPQKLMRDKEGKYPIPTPYDISGSGHWRNKADNCICIWRDVLDDENITDIHIQKIRFAECGKVGKISLRFNWETGGRYEST